MPTTNPVATRLGAQKPAPAKVPTIAEHHKVAAVLSPCTLIPSRKIMPAPRKPIPVTTCAATRVGSPSPTIDEKTTTTRTKRNQGVGPQACHLLMPLAFGTDQ